jgi:hypothetical protein
LVETHCREVLDHLFAQIVINAIDLLFFKESGEFLIESI